MEGPSIEKVISRLEKVGPSKWKKVEKCDGDSYGRYYTEISGLRFTIDKVGDRSDNCHRIEIKKRRKRRL